jgi:type II secretory pathway component PulC
MRARRTFLLIAIAAALGALDWLLWTAPVDTTQIPPVTAAAATGSEATQAATADRLPPRSEALVEVLTRPLFVAGRRPPSGEAAMAGETGAADVLLAGVMLAGSERRALLIAGEGAKAEWVEEGEAFAGWQVAVIDASGVILEADAGRVSVALRRTAAGDAEGPRADNP